MFSRITPRIRTIAVKSAERNFSSILAADSSKFLNKLYHISGTVILGLAPVALYLENRNLEIALAAIIPFNMCIGMNYVVTDYVPKSLQTLSRMGVLGISLMTVVGLVNLTVSPTPLTTTLKKLWRPTSSASN